MSLSLNSLIAINLSVLEGTFLSIRLCSLSSAVVIVKATVTGECVEMLLSKSLSLVTRILLVAIFTPKLYLSIDFKAFLVYSSDFS